MGQKGEKMDFVKLHDEMLDLEHNLSADLEALSDLRERMYREKDKDVLKLIKPTLNSILYDVEKYSEWVDIKGE